MVNADDHENIEGTDSSDNGVDANNIDGKDNNSHENDEDQDDSSDNVAGEDGCAKSSTKWTKGMLIIFVAT